MSDPRTEAPCPCAGRCHHAESPCSLGCWAAQKPWRVEEAVASWLASPEAEEALWRIDATIDALNGNDIEAAHAHARYARRALRGKSDG
jgi:hypothetical protein